MIFGQDKAIEQFRRAWDSRELHHAWLLGGPRGIGKAHFARLAARRVLAEAAGPSFEAAALDAPSDHPIVKLLEAGSHPDMRWIERLPKERGEGLARSITVKQVRELGEFLNLTPALSPWRAIVIDSVDDLEREGANALLKMLEEPPANTIFFLVSHAPGRLLPTIRSRCRRLDFSKLDDAAMTSVLDAQAPEIAAADRQRLIDLAGGSAGRALGMAALDLAPLEQKVVAILKTGDATNQQRVQLAEELGRKGAGDRYAAFLELVPTVLVQQSRRLPPERRGPAIAAYERVRELAALAPRLSLDPAATVFQLGGILASVAPKQLP
ncbi:DNA polymerase III subunit delta' [Sphingomonas sinipercae]|uniref:DNA polymerase III subunit delta n=1 Tax=Sphingomonas sinipercae TaxID=2714944 RepID=A0A6G7ZND5_9SPHN|nr:DNA polymerase III subunit delta' [Sphingomonas sinipercae]QIL02507.1 DNA polymerase III subunit delta' [Sphingomonas sinipercae]